MRVEHILRAIAQIQSYVAGINEQEFITNSLRHDAVLRQFLVIGEAAGRITVEYQKKHPEVPWRIMKNTRNVIIHEYFGVKLEVVWDTIKTDLPALKNALSKLEK